MPTPHATDIYDGVRAKHRVALATPRLPISEHRRIVALQHSKRDRPPNYREDFVLSGILGHGIVEGEFRPGFRLGIKHDGSVVVKYCQATAECCRSLFLGQEEKNEKLWVMICSRVVHQPPGIKRLGVGAISKSLSQADTFMGPFQSTSYCHM